MSKICEVCGKRPAAGNSVSHSKQTTRRWWKPNIQKVRAIMTDGTVRRVKVCTKCLKSGKIKRAI
jgi:large subunit ribosomal protein L28